MQADVTWFTHLSTLLGGTLTTESEEEFSKAVGSIVTYVEKKSCGRCLSKKLFQEAKLEAMIHKLFESYQKGLTSSELCRAKLMRKMIKHDRANDGNLEFIYKTIVPAQVKMMPNGQELLKDPAILFWMREFGATIMDPETIAKQKETMGGLPEKYEEILLEGRKKIGQELVKAVKQGWIDSDKIGMIIGSLALEGVPNEEHPELTEETAVAYFAYCYRALITSGEEHAKAFYDSLVTDLQNYRKDPVVTNEPFPKKE